MSGLDLARKLRQEKHDLKVLYSSGYSIEVAGQDFGLTEGMAFLKKPYQPAALAMKVRECLDLPA
jgi:CheY-like chemotaxis protein